VPCFLSALFSQCVVTEPQLRHRQRAVAAEITGQAS
jgi:hypothetical protein